MTISPFKPGKANPELEYRGPQPYVAIRSRVTMTEIAAALPPLGGEVIRWLQKKGLRPAGPAFWRYLLVDMEKKLEIDVGFPLRALPQGDKRIVADILPGGTYATTIYVGHPQGLMKATAELLSWAEGKGVEWRMDGPRWGGRIEWYLSDPAVEPDMNTWKTELAFLTVDKADAKRPTTGR
jgi:effector-binding domain-containing protein